MNKKQKQFCREYLIDLNATQSAIRAGYSAATARSQGQRLLTHVDISAKIEKLMNQRSERTGITADAVLNELAKIGFGNIKNLYAKNGNLMNVPELPDDVSATIQEVTEDSIGSGPENVIRRKYKLSDKRGSLELLGKHLKLFTDKTELTGANGGAIQHDVQVTFVKPGDIPKSFM